MILPFDFCIQILLIIHKSLNIRFNKIKFTVKYCIILKKKAEQLKDYVSDLEEKIVDLSFKLKNKTSELEKQAELNSLVFKKLVHNLKNPVGIAFSFSEMMLQDFRNYTDEKSEKHLSIINNSSKFSIDLLNSFAFFSRYQLPDLKFHFLEQNFIVFINKVIGKIKPLAKEAGISINCNIPDSMAPIIFDETELGIAITNVLHNAIRYSNSNTSITIIVLESSKNVDVTIIDEGMGISEDNIHQVFNEFFVVNTYSADGKKCIGLGLPIARKIIEMHQGKITILSELEKGTKVCITIPK